jgi:mono/diheme cytochrome c family protein
LTLVIGQTRRKRKLDSTGAGTAHAPGGGTMNRMQIPLRALAVALALCVPGAGFAQAAPAGCPQPRFTGKAPDDYYGRTNPLPASDTGNASLIYQGDGQSIACASCHGRDGDGLGSMYKLFDPPPRNFRCAQTVQGVPDGQLFWIIRFGSPGTSMPPHPRFPDEQVWRLVNFVRQLAR